MKYLKIKTVLLFLAFFSIGNVLMSQVITPFTVKKQITQKGGIVYLSNVATHCSINPAVAGGTCQTGALAAPTNTPAGSLQDNDFNAVYVDIDGDASTFMSTSDSLNLPTCSEISWVGLFWGASRSNTLTAASYQTIKIKANNGAYTPITASNNQTNTVGFVTYHCFADITTFVKAAGIKSRFTVADIFTDQIGVANRFGSWTMVVMYKNDLLTMRQLTCFEGLANIANTSAATRTVSIPVSGFLTPTSGPVTFETGVYAHDGDRPQTGDNLSFNGGTGFVAITDAVNFAGNIMNSTVSNNGVLTPFRKPNLNNTGGLDADIFSPNNIAKNYLANAVTSCTFQMTTGGETYLPQMITTAIDVYEPDLRASIKVTDINGGTANPGDILEYRVKGINIGSDPSTNSFITDTVEQNANYIPNSIRIVYGPNLGLKTDIVGDDQAEYTAASRLIKVRIGTGATAATGGTVINSPAGADSTIFTYSVTVTNSCTKVACDNVIDARAYILGTGAVSTNTFSNGSNPGIFDVFGCPIPGTTSTPITATACATPTAGASSPGVCAGANFTLSASSDSEVTYLWAGPNSFTSAVQNPVLGPSTSSMSGVYSVTLVAYPGCSRTATTSVNINALPTLTASASSTLFCSGITSTLTASGATTYTWNPGALTGASVAVSPTTTTIYTVTGTNGSGCTNTRTVSLTVNTTPSVGAVASSSVVCGGTTATLTASGATSYSWNPVALTGATIAVTPTATTIYTVIGTTGSCSSTRTVSVAFNICPTAVNDATNTIQNTPVTGNAGTNDSGTSGGTFTTGQPTAGTGTITMNPTTGVYTYTPATGFTGTTSATYTLCNGSPVVCSSAVITVTVFPTIVANPNTITTTPSVTTTGTLTTNDGGIVPGTFSVSVTQPSPTTGTITLNPTTGQYTFTPNPTYTGSTTTTYTVCNTAVSPVVCSNTTITIIVSSTVVAVANASTTIINTPVSGNVGTNDVTGVSPVFTGGPVTPGTGTLTINPTTGAYTYTPATGFTGTTTATYTLCNISSPPCSITTITFTVFPAIVANPDVITTTPSVTVTGTLTTNDGGIVPGTFSVSVTQPSPTTGTITLNPTTGQYTFTPNPSYTGSTTTTYTICNTAVSPIVCSTTTITIQVGNLPIAVSNTNTTIQNTPVSGNAGTNDTGTNPSLNPTFTTGQPTAGTGTITMNPTTGVYTYTPATGFTGTTTATYTLCNLFSPPCSTTTITFTVFPTLVANPDAITTTPSVTTTGTLTTNDGGIVPGGTYSTSVTQPSPTTGTITLNPTTGQYTFTPNPSYTGSTTTTYTICNTSVNPIVCSTTTITITVGNLPVAVADASTTIQNTPVSGNIGTNDTGSGALNNPVFTASPVTAGTGTLVVNPTTGAYTYTPATGFTGTTTATYTLCNISSPPCSTTTITFTVFPTLVANPDVITTTPSVTTTGTLTANDGGVVPGGTYSVSVTQPAPTTGTITLNPTTGQYTFTPNPTYTGSTTTTYTICNTAVNPIVCSNTTITIVVSPTVIAVANASTTIINTPVSGNVGTNDVTGVNPVFTGGSVTAGTGTLTINSSTGAYTYTPATGFTGTTTATYTLCNISSPPCSTTTITFTVFPAIVANPDVINTTPSVTATGTLTTNDGGVVPGGTYSTSVTQPSPTTGTITLNPTTGQYTFTPNPTFTGSTTTTYTICNTSVNPIVCSNTTITINVFPNPAPVNDATTTVVNTPVSGNAGTNDGGTTGGTFTTGQPTAGTGTITMNPTTGAYTYTPATGFTGTTTATYTLCNGAPTTCSTAVISVTVFPAIVANPDVIVTTPSVTTTGTLTTNDGGVVPGGTYSTSVTQPSPTTGTITLNPTTGQYTFTPNPTYTGSTTTTYTICNTAVNPIVCSTTTITITVGNLPLAVADATTTIENTPVSGNIGTNDTGSGASNNPVFTASPVTAGTGTLVVDPATGAYTYTPATGFTGTTTATYTLCNLSSPPCSTTTITFTVFPTIVANPDVINTTPSVTVTGTLTTNDGGVVTGGTYSTSVTQTSPTTGTITVDPATGNYTFTPNPSFTGTTSTTYTICNTSVNPVVCSNTTITINVFPNPAPIDDSNTTMENTPVSGDASTNDGGTTGGTFTTGAVTVGTGTITMDPATGQYTYTPSTGFTGTTSATYTLCNGAPTTCSTAIITVTVFPTLAANPDVITTTPSVTVTGTLTTNDGGVVPGGTYSVTVTQPTSTTGTITVDPATGNYTFTPNPAFTGSTTTTYTICNTSVNPIVCSTTTITIIVGNLPVAVADATTTIENTPVSGDASSNDSGAIPTLNPVFTSGPVAVGTGTLVMDPATGQYTYTPATGFTGTTTATYTLCNLSSPPCSTTTITFTVFPTLVANPDVITTTPSVSVTGTLTTNDGGVVPTGTYSITVTQPTTTTGTITVDPATGGYTFTPNPTFTGTTTTTYTICNTSVNPIVCSTTTITIIVGTPKIAVAKTVLSTIKTNATTYQSVFSFNVANLGNTIGTNVQLVDNLNNTFPAPITYTVVGVTANIPLTTNASYDGNTTIAMLSGTNSLNPLQSSIVTLTVNFSPNSTTLTALSNSGIGSTANNPDPTGTGPHTSTDTTDTGTNPDPDGDGIPNEPGENDPTTFGQQIAASKTASTLTKVNATTFQTVFTFNVANVGPVTATNVQLTDNLNNTFLAPMTYTVVGLNANTPLTANGAYDGNTNIALLSGSNSLVSGANALVTLTVNFSTNSSTATTLSNIGIASTATNPDPTGTGPHVSIDTTDAGTNPDPDDDGIPGEPGENDPTTFGQQIGAAKTSTGFTKLNATTFQTVFTFNVANYGAVAATNVQLTDNLNSTFPAPMTFTVVGLNANAPLTANAGYNGNSNIAMLSGTNTLNTSQSALVTLTVNFSPNTTTLTSLSNIGVASTSDAPDPTGGGTHTSTDTTGAGTDPDPDGDGNPNEPGENNPTFFGQQVAGTKTASTLTKVNLTTYQTVFTFNVANVGPVAATNVQLTDNLNNTFIAPMTYTVIGLNANSPLTTNVGYNGNTNIALLSGNNTLNASQSSIVTLTVNFSPNSSTVTSLSNIGIVSSSDAPDPTGGGTHTSTDTTDAGTNPDPDGDGHPNEPGENDPTHFGQQIGVAKTAASTTKLENGDNQTTFVFMVQNLGVLPATNVQLTDNLNNTFPSPITYNISSLSSGSALTTNSGYNGSSNIYLLVGTNTLAVGATETVTLVVTYNMNGSSLTTLYNSGVATTSDAGGAVSSDTTNTGNNPDTNGNGNPNEPGENIPTSFEPLPDVVTNPDFNIPQGFSPNGDGVNDLFVIKGLNAFPNNKLSILNRWGNIVYKMDSYDNTWNGKSGEGMRFGGDDLPEGTYFYILDLGNDEKPYKGYIYLNKTIK